MFVNEINSNIAGLDQRFPTGGTLRNFEGTITVFKIF